MPSKHSIFGNVGEQHHLMPTTDCYIVVGGPWREVFHAATHLFESCKPSIVPDPGCASASCGRFGKSAPALLVERASSYDAVEQL